MPAPVSDPSTTFLCPSKEAITFTVPVDSSTVHPVGLPPTGSSRKSYVAV